MARETLGAVNTRCSRRLRIGMRGGQGKQSTSNRILDGNGTARGQGKETTFFFPICDGRARVG